MELVYVFDAYCGWSYGFARTMAAVAEEHRELPVSVVSGGLFTGERKVPIRQFGYVQGANARISEVTGVPFGEAYDRLIADGSFVMDSEAAARGFAALRQVAPSRAVELAALQQEAFYVDGLSLSDASTYRAIAAKAGRDQSIRRSSRYKLIVSQLLAYELIVGLVFIECPDDIIAIAPRVRTVVVKFVTAAVGIACQI